MDHGPVITASGFQLPASGRITCKELHDKLAKLGIELLIDTLPKWIAGEIVPIPQDDAKATYSNILKKDDGRIDWKKPAEQIERMIRAFNPWPGVWTLWPTDDKILRLRIEEAETNYSFPPDGSPGFIWKDENEKVYVKTGHGSLGIKKITPAGKKSMALDAFCRGYKNFIGSNLI